MNPDWSALWLGLRLAGLATLIALGPGLWLAFVLATREFRGKPMVDRAVTLPLVLPSTVLSYYLLVALGRQSAVGRAFETIAGHPLAFTWQAAIWASTAHAFPLVVKVSQAALEKVDDSFQKAARSLGASEWRVFWWVSLPLAWRGIFWGGMLTFARSLADFGVTLMIAGAK
jgi:molybdate transport system permease protein